MMSARGLAEGSDYAGLRTEDELAGDEVSNLQNHVSAWQNRAVLLALMLAVSFGLISDLTDDFDGFYGSLRHAFIIITALNTCLLVGSVVMDTFATLIGAVVASQGAKASKRLLQHASMRSLNRFSQVGFALACPCLCAQVALHLVIRFQSWSAAVAACVIVAGQLVGWRYTVHFYQLCRDSGIDHWSMTPHES